MEQNPGKTPQARMLEGVDEDATFKRIQERGGLATRHADVTPRDWLLANGFSDGQADDALVLLSFLDTCALIGETPTPSPAHLSEEDRVRLRPVAETLAMVDGNAFFGLVSPGPDGREREWYEGYLADAAALVERNGGWSGWPGQASFASLKAPPAATGGPEEAG